MAKRTNEQVQENVETKEKNGVNKTVCPLTREQFKAVAKPLVVKIGDKEVIANTKDFNTKSFGWRSNERVILTVGDTPVKVMIDCNITVIGSKEAE